MQEYPIPPRWRDPGPDTPSDIQTMILWIRDSLTGREFSTDAGYTLYPANSVGGHASIYRLECDAANYCVKVYSDRRRVRAPREWISLQVFREFAVPRTPRPYGFSDIDGPAFLVMEWIPGYPLGERHLTRPQLQALVEVVKKVHSITPTAVREPLWPCFSNPGDLLRELPENIELLRKNHSEHAKEAASIAQVWLDSDDPALVLEFGEPVFSRGDLNLANCHWDDGNLWIVDFEAAGWRDPVIDLAYITEHVQSRRTPHEEWMWFVD